MALGEVLTGQSTHLRVCGTIQMHMPIFLWLLVLANYEMHLGFQPSWHQPLPAREHSPFLWMPSGLYGVQDLIPLSVRAHPTLSPSAQNLSAIALPRMRLALLHCSGCPLPHLRTHLWQLHAWKSLVLSSKKDHSN